MRLKIIIVLSFFGFFIVQNNASAQQVTWTKNNASLKDVFFEIKKQTNFKVLWPSAALKKVKKIDVNFVKSPLEEVLLKCLKNQGLDFTIVKDVIIIKLKVNFEDKKYFTVIGKVIDVNNKPLARASVTVKGTFSTYYTDEEGGFKCDNLNVKDVLLVSFVGYESKQVFVNEIEQIIRLVKYNSVLQEVMISTGYQDIKKKLMTGAISQMRKEDLVINGNYTIEQMLQGKIAGVDVTSTSGLVGTRQKIRVRGTSTLLGNQDPLWVVDGIIQEDPLPFKASELNRYDTNVANQDGLNTYVGSAISWLNPYDIEDITVLKDAASTAIYGVKAANGVIVINTKHGKLGDARIHYNTNISIQPKLSYDKLNLMNSQERIEVSREIYERGLISFKGLNNIGYQALLGQYLNKIIDGSTFDREVKKLEIINTDWFDLLYEIPTNQMHGISVGGGSENNTYYGSLGYKDQKGHAKGNGQQSYLGSINFSSNLLKRLSIAMRISGDYSNTKGFNGTNPYTYATTTSRAIPGYLEDGELAYYLSSNGYRYHILNELANTGNSNNKTSLTSSINVKYQLPYGFRFESVFGLGFTNTSSELFSSENSNEITALRGYEYGTYNASDIKYKQSPLPIGGKIEAEFSKNINYTFRNSIGYSTTMAKHIVSGLLGIEARSNRYNGQTNLTYGYMPFLGKTIINPPAIITNLIGEITENTLYRDKFKYSYIDRIANYTSYFATVAYSFDDRYVLNTSVRGDASNRFGQDAKLQFKPIWAVGFKWNIMLEDWISRKWWLNDFNLRTTYGYQGNVAENYGPNLIATIPSATEDLNEFTGESILKIGVLPYTNLRMEKTQTLNFGLDMSFFDNRISATIDYYNKKSMDLIVLKEIPFEYGSPTMPVNGGELINKGIELLVNFIPVKNQNIVWSIGMNASKNNNKVTKKLLPNAHWYTATTGLYAVENYPLSSFWVMDYTGPSSKDGSPTFNIPITREGKVDASHYMTYGGHEIADFIGGINSSFRYKNFQFMINAYLSVGGRKLLPALFSSNMLSWAPNEFNNLSASFTDRWKQPGDELLNNNPSLPTHDIPLLNIPGELTPYSSYAFYNRSTVRVVNASFFRINNINFRYTLPDYWNAKIHSKSISVGYSLSNCCTWRSKDYNGVDPEVSSGSQPLPRVHSLNLSMIW